MKKLIQKIRKAFFSDNPVYRYGTHFKFGYGRCYCIQREGFFDWDTIYETNKKHDWVKMCERYR
jgi:hypothetical protein